MNTAIRLSFATPYISSITRDQHYVHSPMPLDGAIAYAIYWETIAGGEAITPTRGQANRKLMEQAVYPELRRVFAATTVGEILGDLAVKDEVFLVSSGFPVHRGETYIKQGAAYVGLVSGQPLAPQYDTQPIRRRVYPQRLTTLGIEVVTRRGRISKEGIDTSRGGLKGIDNKVTAWAIFEYVWFARVLDEARLRELLETLKFQGMGKKRSAGFGRVVSYRLEPLAGLTIDKDRPVFVQRDGQSVLLRPLPYDAISRAAQKIVMTNLMVEFGCGTCPPYWSDRRVVVREGTIFRFLN
jgi:hypothetical protein